MSAEKQLEPETQSCRRVWPRTELDTEVEVLVAGQAVRGTLHNIGQGGVFVSLPALPARAEADAMVRLSFSLPVGAELSVCGRMRWLRQSGGAELGCGIEFYGLGHAELEVIAQYVAEPGAATAAQPSPGMKVLGKYAVESRPKQGRIWLAFNGFLDEVESRDLEGAIAQAVSRHASPSLMAYIDASRFQPSPEGSLENMRRGLRSMAAGHSLMGVMVGSSSVGLLQLRRLAREAGIADALVCFATHAEATAFWDELAA